MVTTRLPAASGRNDAARIYAVGDVHGHADKLAAMHGAIRRDLQQSPAAQPLLIHLGDLIDRGPDSAGCITLLAPGQPIPGVPTVNLMGNHEAMLLQALDEQTPEAVELWLINGGAAALGSWDIPWDAPPSSWASRLPAGHLAFLRSLELHHAAAGFLFVHAGVRPGVPLAQQHPDDLLWIRNPFLSWDGLMLPDAPELVVVHGHTPSPNPVVRPSRIGIDTGAGGGGPLTCVVLGGGSLRFLQV